MLKMMMSLLVWLIMWEFIPNVGRLFHSMAFRSHRSFILMQPTLMMARPLLSPLTPRGWPTTLVTKGLLNIGCLRTFACDVGSVFMRPTLTFIQDLRMFFWNE